jgi:hypothetical protein
LLATVTAFTPRVRGTERRPPGRSRTDSTFFKALMAFTVALGYTPVW